MSAVGEIGESMSSWLSCSSLLGNTPTGAVSSTSKNLLLVVMLYG